MKRLASLAAVLLGLNTASQAGEIGFIEDFALAKDRSVALRQLIPGTEDFYFYHSLHYQNTEQFDKVDEMLAAWIKRYGYTERANEIRYRQALLTYAQDSQKSLEFIRRELDLHFNHQRETIGFKPNLPASLDQRLISRETLTRQAMARYKNLDGFEDRALDWLVSTNLNPDQRRHLIERLSRPDHAKLPQLVLADLEYKYSRGFGAMTIHRQLLLAQLDELLQLKPDLISQTELVNTYLIKLHPANDVDWRHDAPARQAYLDRLWQFVQRLAPAHNSLKAHVLYHRLVHDRALGSYDKERFMAYIALPRQVSYINPQYMQRDESRRWPANLNADFQAVTQLPPIRDDEPLVRSYLHHFFVKETSYKPYETYINDIYLKHNFAETKIVNGLGEAEQWYSMLPPAQYQALKERIDLDFAYTNKPLFGPDEAVSLDLYVKNVGSLIVKVFQINTQNFYRENLREIDTDINLDGLVANDEKTYTYDEPPLRRVLRHFEFPQLDGLGVYVIDFIGNGKSSRALVRKGKLRYLVRTSTAGHVFTVLDESNRHLPDAMIWLAGHQYHSGQDGRILVPFSTNPGRQPIVVSHGEFSSLDHFRHEAENYLLSAGIYVDRQSLLKNHNAQVVIRPVLYLNGTPVTLSVLQDVRLLLTSTDRDGISTSKEVSDFKVYEDRESVYELQTPQRLSAISFTLTAKVQNLSQNKKVDLSTSQSFTLNEIDRTEKIEDLHFAKIQGSYVVDLLGKSGERKPDRPVHFSFKHRDFRDLVTITLQTNDQGRVQLGSLDGIAFFTAQGPEGTSRTWPLLADERSYHRAIHAKVGETILIPYMGTAVEPTRETVSLLELRDETFLADRFDVLSMKDGFLQIGKLPRGDFDLLLKEHGTRIRLRLSEGEERDGYVLSENRQLEVRGANPLQIESIETADKTLVIRLKNATKFARVHVFATRYQPAYSVLANLGRVRDAEPYMMTLPKADSLYVAGRNIGDEFRYIIDRKYAQKFPGNMLERPQLLLNPWAIRQTETSQQLAAEGESFDGVGAADESKAGRGEAAETTVAPPGDLANLDFLEDATTVLVNLTANEEGVIRLDRDALGANQDLHIVACDPITMVYRSVSLSEVPSERRDLRMARGLDPSEHYTQQKRISVVKSEGEFVMPDITTSRFEAYDNLARVFTLYATLSRDPKLNEFSFILNWHKLKPEEKRSSYSKYACHELAFFVQKKDPDFFRSAVQPYLRNKKDKTFLDHWLLEDDLREYLLPWNYAQLNIVERILLAQRIGGEPPYTSRHVDDLFDLIPPNVDRFNHLFNTAVQGSALDTDDKFGVVEQRLNELQKLEDLRAHIVPGFEAPAGQSGALREQLRRVPMDMPSAPAAEEAAGAKPQAAARGRAALGKARKAVEDESRRMLEAKDKADLYFFDRDANRRAGVRQLYRKLDKTQEWVENNYYKLAIAQQNADLVTVNAFWNDYAAHDPRQPFYSTNLAEASRNFTEMMLALAVLDLPPESPGHKSEFDGPTMTLSAAGPIVAFHEEIRPARDEARQTPILVSQNFFRHNDRYRYENNERFDKYVDDEFLVHTVYGCQVVVTNPTSSPRKLDVLLQIPVGAIPVMNTHETRSVHIDLGPYHTQTVEYYFYFPAAGKYPHYPVHVAQNEQLVAFAEPFVFQVVQEPSKLDRTSWAYISQHGSSEDVLAYLQDNNLHRTELDKIAFRMQDERFFRAVIELLAQRHVYNHTLWSYGIKHNVVPAVREYLQHADGFVARCGAYIDSPLLVIDPVVRKTYEHMEYKPLVNARTHPLGRRRQILNDRFDAQYHRLMTVLSYRRELSDDDLMAVTYYMLLQDRIDEAIEFFARVNAGRLPTRLPYDYCDAYLAIYLEDTAKARDIAARYADHPVDRWRNSFTAILAQVDEIEGAATKVIDTESRTEIQTNLAASQPNFEFKVESKKVHVTYQNLDRVTINYYLMDIELLFSRNPFVQQYTGQFSDVRPNQTVDVELPNDKTTYTFDLPETLHHSNVLVELTAAGQTKSHAYFSNSLNVQLVENYGQLRVTYADSRQPAPTTYVKVYALMQDGTIHFYKDGYTDLRGRFDYTSLSTNELDFVRKFSLLVLSDTHGATIREASPPKR